MPWGTVILCDINGETRAALLTPLSPLVSTTRVDPRSSSCCRVGGVGLGGWVVGMAARASEGTQDSIEGKCASVVEERGILPLTPHSCI